MIQFMVAIAALVGIIYLIVKKVRKNPLEERTDVLAKTKVNSEVLTVEEQIVLEELQQKRHLANINKLKGNIDDL